MTFLELAKARYAVRKFKADPVPQEKIDTILEAARVAPTAANKQSPRILIVSGDEAKAKFDICSPCRYGAPLVFLVCYNADDVVPRMDGGESSGSVDASIVTTHMMLQAKELGLDTVWVMMFDMAKLRSEFNIPENIIPVAALVTGYAADDAVPHEFHNTRKPIEEYLL